MTRRLAWMLKVRAPVTVALAAVLLVSPVAAIAQDTPFPPPPSAPAPASANERLILLNFRDSPLDQVLEFVADLRGRTLIKSPGINASITLKSQTRLTVDEALEAIDAILAMNNISLVPMGEKFLKVVQTATARQEGMPLQIEPQENLPENDALISQVIQLVNMEVAEAQPVVQGLIRGSGKIQPLDRTNSMLITDTASNIKRILEILEYIDRPTESKVETRIYELRFAEAGQVAGKLNELIADSQAKEDKPRVETQQPGSTPPVPTIPGVIRARQAAEMSGAEGAAETATATAEAERGLIRGKVKIIADDRSNILFVISRPENFAFFDKIVAVLDRPIEAAIGVRVVPLEYAKAEDISGILNEFIGAASSEKQTQQAAQPGATPDQQQGSRQLDDVVRAAQQQLEAAQATLQEARGEKGVIGRLSPETKILADKRTNSLLLMGRKSDLDALELVLDSLDIMLAQVLIEAVIVEINLGNSVETGFDWLQRSVTAYNEERRGPNGGVAVRTPVFSFGGGQLVDGGEFRGGDTILDRDNPGLNPGGLTYYFTMNDLNLDAIVRLAAQSDDARVLSTPVVLTTDNTEAKIVVASQRPIVTSSSIQTTGQATQNFEYRTIGITITVTPRINPGGFVMMEVSQTADDVLGETQINDTTVPIIGKREISAQVGVQSRSTIVLGGLVRTDDSKARTKVPLLGDIPLLGTFFRSDTKRKNRGELLVLLTPYVLKTPEEALTETKRLYQNSRTSSAGWHKGWSDSALPRRATTVKADGTVIEGDMDDKGRVRKETLIDKFGFEQEVEVPKGDTSAAPAAAPTDAAPTDAAPAPVNEVIDVTPPAAGQGEAKPAEEAPHRLAENVEMMVISPSGETILVESPAPAAPVADAVVPAEQPEPEPAPVVEAPPAPEEAPVAESAPVTPEGVDEPVPR